MSTLRSIDEIMNEMNDQAKAQGRYLGKAFWEITRQPGSILDVPVTTESRERIARLRARRLERRNGSADQTEPAEQLQGRVKVAVRDQPQEETPDSRKEHAGRT